MNKVDAKLRNSHTSISRSSYGLVPECSTSEATMTADAMNQAFSAISENTTRHAMIKTLRTTKTSSQK